MAFRLLNWMNWIFWLGTVALILIGVTGCDEAKSVNIAVNTAIESPLRNTCQSADLDRTSRSVTTKIEAVSPPAA
jgi:hypothetical protein